MKRVTHYYDETTELSFCGKKARNYIDIAYGSSCRKCEKIWCDGMKRSLDITVACLNGAKAAKKAKEKWG